MVLFPLLTAVLHPSSVAEVWGDDAHVFNPRRYLDHQKKEGVPTVGVYGDVLTFCTFWFHGPLLLGRSRSRVLLQLPGPVPALVGSFRKSGASATRHWEFRRLMVRLDSVIELHSLIVEILENFELSFPEGKTILRVPAIAMTCMVEGEREKGVQMPIRVKPLINC